MATPINTYIAIATLPATFTSASFGKPDFCIKVFDQEIPVHSQIIKEHFPYFRLFSDSADKPDIAGQRLLPSGYKYEWVTKIDTNDDSGWNLVNNDTKEFLTTIASPEIAWKNAIFEKLLKAAYNQEYTIGSLHKITRLVAMAGFFRVLPLLHSSMDQVLLNHQDSIATIMEKPCEALEAAVQIRSQVMFHDALILALGPFDDPHFKNFTFDDPQLLQRVQLASAKLSAAIIQIQQDILNGMVVEEGDSFVILSSVTKRLSEDSIEQFEKVSYPYIARQMYEVEYRDISFIRSKLKPVMQNNLRLGSTNRVCGVGDCNHYYLCNEFGTGGAPWDKNQRDW